MFNTAQQQCCVVEHAGVPSVPVPGEGMTDRLLSRTTNNAPMPPQGANAGREIGGLA